jgi:hypothetical protein
MKIDRTINFDNPSEWAVFFDELRRLKGPQRVQVWRERRKARQQQFGYYFGVLLPLAKDYLNETQGGKDEDTGFDENDADVWLKTELRGREIYNKQTGEYLGKVIPSKATWDTAQMAAFVTDVMALLAKGGVKVPAPDRNWRALQQEQRSVA